MPNPALPGTFTLSWISLLEMTALDTPGSMIPLYPFLISKPSIVTPLALTLTASAAAPPSIIGLEVPCRIRGMVMLTFSSYVPGRTCTVSPGCAWLTATLDGAVDAANIDRSCGQVQGRASPPGVHVIAALSKVLFVTMACQSRFVYPGPPPYLPPGDDVPPVGVAESVAGYRGVADGVDVPGVGAGADELDAVVVVVEGVVLDHAAANVAAPAGAAGDANAAPRASGAAAVEEVRFNVVGLDVRCHRPRIEVAVVEVEA